MARAGLAGLVFDPVTATHQSGELATLAGDGRLRDRVVASVLAKRKELAEESGASSTRVAVQRLDGDAGASALIARGEVLIVDPDHGNGVRLLERLGYRSLSGAGPVLRLRRPTADATEVASLCQALRALGVAAAPNYVTAAGPIAKGVLGIAAPQPTRVDPGNRPAGDLRGSGIRVAIVDTGIDRGAAEASTGWLEGIEVSDGPGGNRDLLDSVPAPDGFLDDAAGHGTFVAGVVRQLAPACEVTVVRALDSDGVGTEFATAEALFDLADSPAPPHVVNLSLACLAAETLAPVAMRAAIEALRDRHPDTVIVAAAGMTARPCRPGRRRTRWCCRSEPSTGSGPRGTPTAATGWTSRSLRTASSAPTCRAPGSRRPGTRSSTPARTRPGQAPRSRRPRWRVRSQRSWVKGHAGRKRSPSWDARPGQPGRPAASSRGPRS
jgi:Subtilase family